ncbi:MAG: ATP-dependent DNA helicase RecG [Tidjanibacter sp.]|nr:ATP-dependent DNA helicase RecG [Tidjanibacter sp.]
MRADMDIKFLSGVGEKRASLLATELGIKTVGDLLHHYPHRYIDRTKVYRIASLSEENATSYVQLRGRIIGKAFLGEGRKQRLSATLADSTGQIELVWFQQIKWVEKQLEVGREYLILGKPTFFGSKPNMVHPEVETVEKFLSRGNLGMQGVYSTTERLSSIGLASKGLYSLVCTLWENIKDSIVETLPEGLVSRLDLLSRREALQNIHFPTSPQMLQRAIYRLKFEELFGAQLGILSVKAGRTTLKNGFLFPRVGELFHDFYENHLPFSLTGAQKRVIKEIRHDCVSGHQMNRLLQGDVGSGKTLVALMAMLLASDNGYQSCMMAPTEILARQHYASISKMLKGTSCEGRVAVLTGSTKTRERREILERTLSGEVQILVGTHALIEDRVKFDNLGLVVIDEQHRFGVEQRAKLWTKNSQPPHILVMTATPIPRTLAMTLYGDLEVSVIDEMPAGRKPIKTYHLKESLRLKINGFLKQEIAKGRQVYVVYPLIKESEAMDYQNLYDGFEHITQEFPLPEYKVGALHGKMSPEDKAEAMRLFAEGVNNILVATSVIEVGVDVPNATVIVIESAERFGLSQLHQLRGRVGRGGNQSFCLLVSGDNISRDAEARLSAMVETNDGFALSELDLKLRGAGDVNGTRQSGEALDLRIASLSTDGQILEQARLIASTILNDDPTLAKNENRTLATLRDAYKPKSSIDYGMIS